VEAVAFQQAYPDAESRARMTAIADNPAVRMLQGVPRAVGTTGGYVVWDAGWFILAVVGMWAIVVATRLARGEEDLDRAAFVLAGPVGGAVVLRTQLAVLAAVSSITGGTIAASLVAAGTPAGGAALFGTGIAAFGATIACAAAVAAQIFPTRRRALGAAGALLGVAYIARMVANSADDKAWLGWLTPFGWVDQLRAYEANRVWALAPLVLAPLLLAALAVRLRGLRDAGAAVLAASDRRDASLRGLRGPAGFAWRLNRGVLAGWAAGVTAYAFVLGSVASAVTRLVEDDPDYRKLLESLGMGMAFTDRGFVALMGPMLGLLVALYTCWRVGAARSEEAAGLADTLLARPVSRVRWLGGHLALAVLGALLLEAAAGAGLWLGAASSGADVTGGDAAAVAAGSLPLVVLVVGLAVLAFGAFPRVGLVASVAVTVSAYLLEFLGPALHLPGWVLAASPFHHLAYVPVEPFAILPAAVLVLTGTAAATTGLVLFRRRDVVLA
jgi:ABC-2 type transport system permease protein